MVELMVTVVMQHQVNKFFWVCFNATFSNISAISWRQHQVKRKFQQCYYYDIYIFWFHAITSEMWETTYGREFQCVFGLPILR